ncbi:MAG: YihY/virulence factor BrkB family protein [Microthrixaceae bacterium]
MSDRPAEPATAPADPPRRNLIDRTADRVDAWQRRVPPLALGFAVTKKYGEDRGGQLAMLLAYRGFFAIFPLLLAFVNVLGLVLAGNDELRNDLIDSALSNIPVIGGQIRTDAAGGSVAVVVASVLVSLWAGLGLLEMLQESLNTVWGVPMFERPPWVVRRLRSLPAAVVVIGCLVLSGSRSWLFGGADGVVGQFVGALLPFLGGALCYLGLHWALCQRKVPFPAQLPGAAFVGLGWFGLQLLGEWYVNRFVVRSSDTYGVFVIVFGVLSWSYLLGTLYLYGNELASVLHERRWPRSLSGRDLTDADRAAYRVVAEREVRVRGTELTVDVPRDPAPPPS